MTVFATLDKDGRIVRSRSIPQSAIRDCPHYIMMPEDWVIGGYRCVPGDYQVKDAV